MSMPRSTTVLCHYMPWFERSITNGKTNYEHWKWGGENPHNPDNSIYGNLRDIASVYYPRIGVYDSSDADVLDYHILTAKAAGIDAFVVDWHKPHDAVDRNMNILFERAEKLNFKVMVCYEEKACFPHWNQITQREEAVKKAVSDFRYLADKYFSRSNYWKKNEKPCVIVFSSWGEAGGIGKKVFTPGEWDTILAAAPDIYLGRQNFDTNYTSSRSAFAWDGDKAYSDWYYVEGDNLVKSGKLDFYIGSALPGFDDRGVWGWGDGPRFTANMGLDTFSRYWDAFEASACDVMQIVTWNDFEEGTVIEPTVQFGNLYLDNAEERISQIRGTEPKTADNSLPYNWFVLRKFAPETFKSQLDTARSLLANGKTEEAEKLLDIIQTKSKTNIPTYLDMNHEYPAKETNKR